MLLYLLLNLHFLVPETPTMRHLSHHKLFLADSNLVVFNRDGQDVIPTKRDLGGSLGSQCPTILLLDRARVEEKLAVVMALA